MFTGLSAFPLTPLKSGAIDEAAYLRLLQRLTEAKVDSISALGSTGNYAYFSREDRANVARLAIEHSAGIPVMIGIGALTTKDVLYLAEDAQKLGAKGLLLAPVSYQKLTHDEVYGLYHTVVSNISVPLCIYDNPNTTHFQFNDELYARISRLPNIASIKIPAIPSDKTEAQQRVAALRKLLPSHITIGISGDWNGALGLNSGCDAWYSVIGGLFPELALGITRASKSTNYELASELSSRLEPLWALFQKYGSLRVMASAAEQIGLVSEDCLPAPLQSLSHDARLELSSALKTLKP